MNLSPSSWPSPAVASPTPTHKRFPTSSLSDPFGTLPTELLLVIFSQLPIPSLFTLSAASRNLRALITEPAFLNQTIKAAVLTGSAFWILPVKAIAGEEERARHTAMEWLATVSTKNSALDVKSPFHSASFPYFAFVHACYESDSMRNRERFWNIIKQFDKLWRDYRLHGWQRDVFVH
jgi:F-box-like